MEWPRIPLPGWPELSASALSGRDASRSAHSSGGEGGSASDPSPAGTGGSRTAPTAEQAAQTLAASAARGRELARLLDSDAPVPGVTTAQRSAPRSPQSPCPPPPTAEI